MSTDPIAHLLTLPDYPEGSRVAEGDNRFWGASFANGDKCVFVELERQVSQQDLGDIVSSIVLHADVTRSSRLIFRLQDSALSDKFLTMFVAIANESEEVSDGELCRHIKEQILEWASFLSPNRNGLSDEKLRGLWGELFVLEKYLCHRLSPAEVVSGYTGILNDPQDLVGHDFCIEVKTTISRAPSKVSISSLEQLDTTAPQILVLLTLASNESGDSLSHLIDKISAYLAEKPRVALQFKRLVAEAISDATDNQLIETFSCVDEIAWEVGSDFPALRRSTTPASIVKAQYAISIQHLSKFVLDKPIGDWLDGIRAS